MAYHNPKSLTEEQFEAVRRNWIILPEEGKVISKRFNAEIGSLHNTYIMCTIVIGNKYRVIKLANLIWWEFHKKWPSMLLDHSNRIRIDDRIGNLKLSTVSDNNLNSERSEKRELPFNVYKWFDKYKVSIHRGKPFYVGLFDSIEEAVEARDIKLLELVNG